MTKSLSSVDARLEIKANEPLHTMRGGIGASWHAMSREIPLENDKYDYPVRYMNPRGSAYGGNPPATDSQKWLQIFRHASWLGLNFIRVEISQRMYEPQRGVFDWDNEEMSALYNILGWCERSGADVFLQQMWGHVEWNSFPGVHPLLSAPRSVDDFAAGITALLDHLLNVRKFKCVRYLCITNEPPGGTWGYWWSYGPGSGTITPALKSVKEHLEAAGIEIPLSGPDWTSLPPLDPSSLDFDAYVGAYDIHSYDGIDDSGERIVKAWTDWAHSLNKPFFLTEFGNMKLGWGGDNPGPKTFDAALSNASDILRCLNLGVDGLNRWSFVNRGDLDGQWQLIRTWDSQKKFYFEEIVPEPEAYFGFAMVTRFIGKYAKVVRSLVPPGLTDVSSAALVNRTGELTAIVLNNGNVEREIGIRVVNHDFHGNFQLYQLSQNDLANPAFELKPLRVYDGGVETVPIMLPPKSLSTLTNFNLGPQDRGVI